MRAQLGRVLFSGPDVTKRVALLSGGEAARLIFALLAVQKPNVLVLDEPTNHLDLEAIHALVEAVKAYTGTVVFVSHDRWFVSALATRVVEITPEGPRDFPGTYAEYLAKLGDDHLDGDAVALRARAERADKKADAPTNGAARDGDRRELGGSEEAPQPRRAAPQAARQGPGRDLRRRGPQGRDSNPLRRPRLLPARQPRRDRRAGEGTGVAGAQDRRAGRRVGGDRAGARGAPSLTTFGDQSTLESFSRWRWSPPITAGLHGSQ